ncbi:uncharacterized protein K489DRAFT_199180 [Dissoconium aciculare CBS 342.82]|uniref:Uncharacterized protein n=1 Tax=Dissoconium aciculare CBS 342.82 TaxID=1314786 RepID=A0A6J3M7L6_9PEZI|nr:uncharacterized protein K489DRAFT_199180 [Dissoconium aciculare CBS 342.82]KAF1823544.1 hypothetical protein K489DRAFT_199180 [Dissoconium aciculare CBS 342.82]
MCPSGTELPSRVCESERENTVERLGLTVLYWSFMAVVEIGGSTSTTTCNSSITFPSQNFHRILLFRLMRPTCRPAGLVFNSSSFVVVLTTHRAPHPLLYSTQWNPSLGIRRAQIPRSSFRRSRERRTTKRATYISQSHPCSGLRTAACRSILVFIIVTQIHPVVRMYLASLALSRCPSMRFLLTLRPNCRPFSINTRMLEFR